MENGIKYLETEKYTPQQISNPKLNLNFEPINPVEAISGYRRSYRPEVSSQQSSDNSETPTSQETRERPTENPSDKRTESMPVQETVQAKPVSEQTSQETITSEQQTHTQETAESKNGKIYTNPQDFVKDMTEAYTKALTARGISTDYAKMLVAQDALESNWGKSSLSKDFNFGGIKAIKGTPFVEKETKEYDSKKGMYRTKSKFRKFNSLDDYVNYKIDLLSGKRYQAFTGDPSKFYSRVKAGGYATDPNYVAKLTNVYNSSILSAKQGGNIPWRIDILVAEFNKRFNK